MARLDDKKQKERIEEFYRKEEEDLMKILADRYGIPYINLASVSINGDALRLIPEREARDAGAASFGIKARKVLLAVLSPKKNGVKKIIEDLKRKGYDVVLYIASKASLEKAWSIYKELSFATKTEAGVFDISGEEVEELAGKVKSVSDIADLIKETIRDASRYKISRILEVMLAGAISLKASDIHAETEEDGVRIRFRFDGVLHDIATMPQAVYKFILSRIKLLSGLKLNIREDAQDGRFSIKIGGEEIEIRTSVLPSEYGESVVMRLLNPQNIAVRFEDLGIEEKLFRVIEREIRRPNGMILTTGPTGSGKTTTLYAILRRIYTPEIKIITIEDPIEYHLKGVSQTQVNAEKGYTFLQGLRSALRQDPDVIMVGEIRDGETASIAVNAALTGHLVLSTLHTNNAAGVIPRLIDLGVNPKIISSALNLSLAQRLVRKLCETCKKKVPATSEEKELLAPVAESVKKKRGTELDISFVWRPDAEKTRACGACGGIGYKGRIGIFEGILTDDAVEEVIVTFNPSEREVKKAAEKQGIFDMREDGVVKALSGITSLEELRRVVDLSE